MRSLSVPPKLQAVGPLHDLVTCLYIFCLQWGWDASIPMQKALESHRESILKGQKFFSSPCLIYFGEQYFCYVKRYSLMGLHASMVQKTDMWLNPAKGPFVNK